MTMEGSLLVLQLLILCAVSAPVVDKDIVAAKTPDIHEPSQSISKPIVLESEMGIVQDNGAKQLLTTDDGNDRENPGSSSEEDHATGIDEDPDEMTSSYFDYGSLPSWYVDALFNNNDDITVDESEDDIVKYRQRLNELIIDLKLKQIYQSIKTLQHVLDDLLGDNNINDEDAVVMTDYGNLSVPLHPLNDGNQQTKNDSQDETEIGRDARKAMFTKQLETMRNKNKDQLSKRVKRELSWDDVTFFDEKRSDILNDFMQLPNANRMIKIDDDSDDGVDFEFQDETLETGNDFQLTKHQIQDALTSFVAHIAANQREELPSVANQFNINVGDQRLSQQIWYPNKRATLSRQIVDRNYLDSLPTLEGMKKRDGNSNRQTYLLNDMQPYFDEKPMVMYQQFKIKRDIEKLAEKLSKNSKRAILRGPKKRDFSNGRSNNINMWFENRPLYNIGVQDEFEDVLTPWNQAILDRPDPHRDYFDQFEIDNEWEQSPRMQRRSQIFEKPSLPGPYQGYLMESQLWQDMLQKRGPGHTKSRTEKQPVTIDGPNAWGNFIFINDNEQGLHKGKWLSRPFDDRNEGLEMDSAWVDGINAAIEEEIDGDIERAWVDMILGVKDEDEDGKRGFF